MIDEPQIVQTKAVQTAYTHITVPADKMQEVMGPGYGELMDTLKAQGVTPTGPWFTRHLKMEPGTFDFEISVPVATPVNPAGRMQAGQLPATTVARTVYHGPYEGLGAGWGEFEEWIKKNGHTSAADLWEVYAIGPESGPDSSRWQTQLNRPLVK